MNYLKISIGIFAALAASRFIPHPPNFTSLLALSFYVPALLGIRYLPTLLISFVLTDLVIGFHGITLFTWGSIILIGLGSRFFISNIFSRIGGALSGVFIFYIVTNFGVWSLGSYGYNFQGLINCYTLALPFLGNTLISTILFSSIIEAIFKQKIVFKKI
ncbi:hypothetical protein N9K40_04450 [Candidatus Pelagibacter sp.]|jgi:hypothetical protein|nr:hypothetical protein [Candidatus Pelagibacter sp.]|tara:strand:- start:51 stop:530 length:480 start_codon:yes stop_codon:yes gene_type:complete